MIEEGKPYTMGDSFRARAEDRQRQFRTYELRLPQGEHAHWLREEDAEQGANFFGRAYEVVKKRAEDGKGVDMKRTSKNMLSSQAMCFNIFGYLQTADGLVLAAKTLQKFVPTIRQVRRIDIEYTPNPEILGDQSGLGGVDCDVLIEYATVNNVSGLLTIETKFVEEEFSTCAFRKKGNCMMGTCSGDDFSGCLYASKKKYRYWEQSRRLGTLKPEVLQGKQPCPFGNGLWQLWVNHTLVHTEASDRKFREAAFAVCAPKGNNRLLKGGKTIDDFKKLLTNPASMLLIELEDLIDGVCSNKCVNGLNDFDSRLSL